MGTTQDTFALIRRVRAGILLTVIPVALMYGGFTAANADHSAADLHAPHHSHVVSNGHWVPR